MRADAPRFYGPATGLPMGAGIVVRDCPFAVPADGAIRYHTVIGLALAVTHECDIDEMNDRQFNDLMIVCPIVPLESYCVEAEEELGAGGWGGFLPQIVSDRVFRVMYLPPIPRWLNCPEMQYGGIIYFNAMVPCRLAWLSETNAKSACSLSAVGLRAFDYKFQNHFGREKAASLWFQR